MDIVRLLSQNNLICYGDNLDFLTQLPSHVVDLIYIDPPFNTGVKRIGKDRATNTIVDFADAFDDFASFLLPRLEEAYRVLKPHGSFFLHIDYREVHYCKVLLDRIFGRDCFQNEIIWAYDYGGRSKKKWPAKHDNILWYTRDPKNYTFNFEEMDRIPYMAPVLVGKEKAARGKTPTDVWWHTIVPTNGYERTGYPTQKPLGILDRIVKIHSRPDDIVLDFFAGSGTAGEAAARLKRRFILIDNNYDAIRVMSLRLSSYNIAVSLLP